MRGELELEHRGLESLCADREDVRGIFDTPTCWDGLLARSGAVVGRRVR
jgi:hypothetical protein